MPTDYTEDFFEYHRDGARRSAQEIVPLVIDLVQPRSAIDVGCGSGSWLAVFKEYGILDVLGVDGSYIDSSVLEIPEDQFLAHDLRKPLEIDRQFDLVVSVEVAEHIPQEYAEIYINSLARLGPIVLFSAAIPLQGGTNHLNEQWPEYWVEHFEHRGYVIVDAIRKSVWQNDNIAVWYAQNIILFVRRDYLEDNLRLLKELENTNRSQLSIIHPKLFIEVAEKNKLHKEKAEFYIAEAEQLKADAHIHRQKIASYSAEVEQLKAEVQTHKAKAESYIAEAEQFKADAHIDRQEIASYSAEVEQLKAEVQTHKAKAESYIAEAEQLKADAHIHRQKIASYSTEVEQLKAEVQTHKAKAEFYIAEVERLNSSRC